MQHLAKVHHKDSSGKVQLQLLARQIPNDIWEALPLESNVLDAQCDVPFNEGAIVLCQVEEGNKLTALEDATPWILELVSQYLCHGVTPSSLKEESVRLEEWRQKLTLDNQEVRRRALETAARRDEIQELEKNLKVEREELERKESELKKFIDQQTASSDPNNQVQPTLDNDQGVVA